MPSRKEVLFLVCLVLTWPGFGPAHPALGDDPAQVPVLPDTAPTASTNDSETTVPSSASKKSDTTATKEAASRPPSEAKDTKDTKDADSAKCDDKASGGATDKSIRLNVNWKDGFVATSADKDFRFHVGGRVDFDSGWYHVPANVQDNLNTPLLDGTDLRRFRFRADGSMYEQYEFMLEADFSRGADFRDFQSNPQTNVFITNAWVALHDLPYVDTVRIGHQKEYMTFSNGSSANFIPFMERPYIFDAYENNFSWDNGISTNQTYCDQHATSWFGVFWNGTRSQAFNVGGAYAVSGRLTWLPIYDEAEQAWLNLGVSGSLRSSSQPSDPTAVIVRPLVRTGSSFQVPNLINTGQLPSQDGLKIFGTGVHAAWGRFTFGSEFLCWILPNAYTGGLPNPDGSLPPGVLPVGNLFFSGFYVEALYFLTPGDHQPINRVIPGYDRVRPVRNFRWGRDCDDCLRGPGAWEVGLRYDHVDANSGLVQGGRLDSITAGLNWYLNPNMRIMVNYVWTQQNVANAAADGSFSALGVRLHLDF